MQSREEVTVDDALGRSVGEFGRGQGKIFILVNTIWAISALQVFSTVFVESDPIYSGSWECLSSSDKICNKVMMAEYSMKSRRKFCHLDRDQWDWTNRTASIVSDFELQCEEWKVHLIRLLFFCGQLLGSGIIGYLCDKIGRQKGLFSSVALSSFALLAGAFSPNYWAYGVSRFFSGLGFGGQVVSSFVLWTEFVGPSNRGKLGMATQLMFVLGQCMLGFLSYLIPAWRKLVLINACLALSFTFAWMWIPESPRWLLVKGRKGEATGVLAAVASANRKKLPEQPLVEIAHLGNTDRVLWEVVKNRKMRKSLAIILALWLSVCMIFYGVPLMVDDSPGGLPVNFILSAVVEIPAYLLCALLVDKLGRKPLFVWGFFIASACCLALVVAPMELVLSFLVIAKFATSGVFALAFIYTTETFPTSVRGTCLGVASSSARFGGLFIQVMMTIFGTILPLIALGAFGIIAGMLALGLPETAGLPLPDVVEEGGQFPPPRKWFRWGRKKASLSYTKFEDLA